MVLRPARVLWPTDFSELSLHGGRYARAVCDTFQSQLHVVHVIAPPVAPDASMGLAVDPPAAFATTEVLSANRQLLESLAVREFGSAAGMVLEVFFGNPWSGICEYAQRQAIDLIVVATHGRTGLRRVLIGSTAERIVQHAPCPVLVVKSEQREFVAE